MAEVRSAQGEEARTMGYQAKISSTKKTVYYVVNLAGGNMIGGPYGSRDTARRAIPIIAKAHPLPAIGLGYGLQRRRVSTWVKAS